MLFKWLPALKMAFLAARLRKDPIKNARGRTPGRAVSKDSGFTFPGAKALISSSNETTGECQVQVLSRRSSQIRLSALLRFTANPSPLFSISLALLQSSSLLFFSPLPFICGWRFFLASTRRSSGMVSPFIMTVFLASVGLNVCESRSSSS